MAITLEKLVIHEVIKTYRQTGSRPFLTAETIEINENTTFFIDELNKSFSGDRINYGIFSNEEESHLFRDEYSRMYELKYAENAFIEFSKQTTTNLSNRISGIAPAKGGYLVYAFYTSRNVKYTGVFFVRDAERVILTKTEDNKFDVSKIENVETDKLAMACRIVHSKYDNQHSEGSENDEAQHYLQFIKNKQERVSDYFLEWIAAAQTINSKQLTDMFVEAIQSLGVGKDEDGKTYTDVDDFHKAVSAYINSTPNNTINLHDIGQRFYGEPEKISNYVEENDISLDTEFRANGTALRRLYRLEFKHNSILLKFNRGDWNTNVRVRNNQVVINDSALANKITQEFED